jgi:hypothetical protein
MYMLCYFSINVQDYFLVLHFFVAIDPYMGVSCVNRVTYIILLCFCKIILPVIYLSTSVSISNENPYFTKEWNRNMFGLYKGRNQNVGNNPPAK